MATTSQQCEHHTSSNDAEQTRFEHDRCKNPYNECKLLVRRILKTSSNLEARKRNEITRTNHVNPDSIINKIITVDPKKYKVKRNCRKIFNKNQKMWDGLIQLYKAASFSQSQYITAAKKYLGGRDLSKIFRSTYITFVENI